MKTLIKKHWAFIGLIAAFIVDHMYEILANTGLSEIKIDLIKLFGVFVVGYFWNPKKDFTAKKDFTNKEGGAVIPNKGF